MKRLALYVGPTPASLLLIRIRMAAVIARMKALNG